MIIILAILLGILLFTSRRACAAQILNPDRWITLVEDEDGTACYLDLETAFFMKRPDGNHVFFWTKSIQKIAGRKFELLTRNDMNLSRRTSRITKYAAFNEKGEMDERVGYAPEDKKVHPIRPKSILFYVYQLALEQFISQKLLPKDAVSAFENPDPERWVQVPSVDETCYVDVKNAAFPIEADGPHAVFWFQKKGKASGEPQTYSLWNIDINLIAQTQRLSDFAMLDEKGKLIKGISWTELTQKFEPFSPRGEIWAMYEVILGRYAAEKVVPSETAFVFHKPDPERWVFIEEHDGLECYVDRVNTVFFKAPDGERAVFWYQLIPANLKEIQTRQLLRFTMNLTKRTSQLTDVIIFDENGAVEKSYAYMPGENKASEIFPETIMGLIYEYLLERSKSAEWITLKPQEPKKAAGAKKPKKAKRKKTYGKTKRGRKK